MSTGNEEQPVSGGLQVVARSAQILRMFDSERTEVRINDVAEELSIGRTSAHRYLQSLASEGFLQRINDSDYQLGPLIVGLAASMAGGPRLLDIANPELERLAAALGQTAVLGIWSGASAVAVACKEPPGKSVNMTVRIGAPLGPDSAQGMAFLAWGKAAAREKSLTRLEGSANTLQTRIKSAVANGFTTSTAVIDGVEAMAAPIFDSSEQMAGTLALVAPTGVLDSTPGGTHVTELLAAAAHLSSALGFTKAA